MFYGHLTSVTDARSTAVIVASGTIMILRMTVECHYLQFPYSKGNNCSRQPYICQHSIIWSSINLNLCSPPSIQLHNLTYLLNGLRVTTYCAQGSMRFHLEPHEKANYPRSPYASIVLVPHLFRGFQNMDLLHFSLASLDGGCVRLPIECPHIFGP